MVPMEDISLLATTQSQERRSDSRLNALSISDGRTVWLASFVVFTIGVEMDGGGESQGLKENLPVPRKSERLRLVTEIDYASLVFMVCVLPSPGEAKTADACRDNIIAEAVNHEENRKSGRQVPGSTNHGHSQVTSHCHHH